MSDDNPKVTAIRAKRTNYGRKRRYPRNKKVEQQIAEQSAQETTEQVDTSDTLDVSSVPHETIPPVFKVNDAVVGSIPDPQKISAMERIRQLAGIKPNPQGETYKPTPLTGDVLKAAHSVSDIIAGITSGVLGWIFILANPEYGYYLAPSKEVAKEIIEPLTHIYARHNKFVKEVSPDVIDLTNSVTALNRYIEHSWKLLQEIRKDKEEHGRVTGDYRTAEELNNARNGSIHPGNAVNYEQPGESYSNRPYEGETGLASDYARRVASRRSSFAGDIRNEANDNTGNGRYVPPITPDNLTEEQQSAYAKLQLLSKRDFENRARRSGRL